MSESQLTSKQYFRQLTIIHSALIIGQLLFLAVSLKVVSDGEVEGNDDVFKLIAPSLLAGGAIIGFFLRRSILAKAQKKELRDKLGDFRTATIVQCALLEGPSLFSIVCFLLTGNLLFLALVVISLALQFFARPTREKVMTDFVLSDGEISLLYDPEAMVAVDQKKYRN
ncbi:hypothetical protein [Desertivirga brevis]|uniref:hypothetical protein n=1 Tax=Desertivirga brevis TaxID=2810310 RepID=UPI001A95814D|nr:hypothetical protein [Pedobacter sp. SYSU D00873]